MPDYMPRALPTPPTPADDPLKCAVALGNRVRTDKGAEGVRRYVQCMREFLPRPVHESLCRALDVPVGESAPPVPPPQPALDPKMQMLQMLLQLMNGGRPDAQNHAGGGLPLAALMQLFPQMK